MWHDYFAQVNVRGRQQWTGIYKENTDFTENQLEIIPRPGKHDFPHPPLIVIHSFIRSFVRSFIALGGITLYI